MLKKGFTLAEVLITLAIIGVVAALTIPSVVANTQQQEFKTGLKKAVSVLNSAITMNMAIDGESPYENSDLYRYLQRHMSVMKSLVGTPAQKSRMYALNSNLSFYTTDGMRFEFSYLGHNTENSKLYESEIKPKAPIGGWGDMDYYLNGSIKNYAPSGKCGSYGLNNNTDNTTEPPCFLVVDVNGDRKPFPKNASCFHENCGEANVRKFGDVKGRKLTDTFSILITDKQAIPFGMAAQKAMYEAQK